jgi:hypothetical protein
MPESFEAEEKLKGRLFSERNFDNFSYHFPYLENTFLLTFKLKFFRRTEFWMI